VLKFGAQRSAAEDGVLLQVEQSPPLAM